MSAAGGALLVRRAPLAWVPSCHFDREGLKAPLVTLSSSSHAYAVSILPIGKMHDLQGGSSSSQKSRCAAIFGSPVFSAQSNGSLNKKSSLSFRPRRAESPPSGEILRGAHRLRTFSFFMPSPFLRGKGDRLRWMRVDLTLLLSLPITRTISPHQALRASFPLRRKPCIEPCSERLIVLYKIPPLGRCAPSVGMTETPPLSP